MTFFNKFFKFSDPIRVSVFHRVYQFGHFAMSHIALSESRRKKIFYTQTHFICWNICSKPAIKTIRNRQFSTYATYLEKVTFLTTWYTQVCVWVWEGKKYYFFGKFCVLTSWVILWCIYLSVTIESFFTETVWKVYVKLTYNNLLVILNNMCCIFRMIYIDQLKTCSSSKNGNIGASPQFI